MYKQREMPGNFYVLRFREKGHLNYQYQIVPASGCRILDSKGQEAENISETYEFGPFLFERQAAEFIDSQV